MISSLYMTWNVLEASMLIHFDSSESFQRIEFDSKYIIHSRFQHNLSVIKLVDWHVIKIYQVELSAKHMISKNHCPLEQSNDEKRVPFMLSKS